ncbi:hypothetical protein ACI5CP_000430 [Cronobacter turicensis]
MEQTINNLIREINELKRENQKIKVATNFLFYSIVELLDERSGEDKFSEALKIKLTDELNKISMGGASIPKHAINELMQPPVRGFGSSRPEPFLK